MLGATLLVSAGTHVIMPVRDSLTMGLGTAEQRGRRLGQVGAVRTVGSIAGASVVWLVFEGLSGARGPGAGTAPAVTEHAWEFEASYWMSAAVCLAAAVCFVLLRNVGDRVKRSAMIVRRRYGLYYLLHVLNGARKQIFLTFGRWVLVTVFGQPASLFAKLWIVASLIGVGFTPLVGRVVDRFGERRVLIAEAWLLLLVCAGYGSAQHMGLPPAWALGLVSACFVGDQLFFALGMARETYVSKIAVNRQELVATLSMGVTINHLISMTVPSAGGLVWERWGYEWVFAGGAGLAILMWIAAARVPRYPSRQ
jgi:hypothetical protein